LEPLSEPNYGCMSVVSNPLELTDSEPLWRIERLGLRRQTDTHDQDSCCKSCICETSSQCIARDHPSIPILGIRNFLDFPSTQMPFEATTAFVRRGETDGFGRAIPSDGHSTSKVSGEIPVYSTLPVSIMSYGWNR
jgi:hypothetical protein